MGKINRAATRVFLGGTFSLWRRSLRRVGFFYARYSEGLSRDIINNNNNNKYGRLGLFQSHLDNT